MGYAGFTIRSMAELQHAHALLTHKIANYRKIEQRICIGGPQTVEAGVECMLASAS